MLIDFATTAPKDRYKVVSSVVVPRPIAWMVTRSAAGVNNAAPYSFFNVLSNDPMLVGIGCGARPEGGLKDTVANIRETGQFVLCLVSEDLAEAMNVTAAEFPPGVDEIAAAGLHTAPSATVAPPRIAESPVALECELFQLVPAGEHTVVLGKVLAIQLRDDCMQDPARFRVDTPKLRLVGRLGGGGWYTRTGDRFEMPRLRAGDPRLPKVGERPGE
ncbi:flavin reductase family protein [Roseomonas sp. BN140053]|uniref:flavin reductase family protein n=1 Tax=Roseomonas sp. BN140053 TaxID=3391898 RepID=UPI0039E9E578